MKLSATAEPTVRWKCPGTNMVLCTTRFTLKDALISPLTPPREKRTIPSSCAATDGSRHGRAVTQPKSPRPPRARPPISKDAKTVNAVMALGMNTANVRKAWMAL